MRVARGEAQALGAAALFGASAPLAKTLGLPCAAGVADPGRGLARWEVGPGRWEQGDGTWLVCPFAARFEFPAGSRYEWLAENYLIA